MDQARCWPWGPGRVLLVKKQLWGSTIKKSDDPFLVVDSHSPATRKLVHRTGGCPKPVGGIFPFPPYKSHSGCYYLLVIQTSDVGQLQQAGGYKATFLKSCGSSGGQKTTLTVYFPGTHCRGCDTYLCMGIQPQRQITLWGQGSGHPCSLGQDDCTCRCV